MTKEQIEEASEKFAEENVLYPEVSCESDIITLEESIIAAFKDGADWRINSVWHKPEEVPEVNARLLVECAKGFELWTLEQGLSPHWKAIVELNKITSWAYLNDLIPTEDERDS